MDRRELLGRRWTFRWADGGVIAQGLALLDDGSVGGAPGTEHAAWDVIDGNLCFLNAESYCIYRFSTVTRRDDGALDFAGRYTQDIDTVRGVTLSEDCAPLAEIMQMFESLGDNCEFGIAQRYCGADPLDVFRFAWISLPNLLTALADRLAAFDRPEALTFTLDEGRNYHGQVKAYGMHFHTFRDSGTKAAEEVHALVRKKLLFTRRKFFEDLQEGNRLYVRKASPGETLAQIIPLYEMLRSFGERTLLWVTLADGAHPDGTVEQIRDGLFRGYVGRFAYGQLFALRVNTASWAKLCRKVVLSVTPPLPLPASPPAPTMRWTAQRETFVKASFELAASLTAADKIPVREGDTLEAEAAGVGAQGDHIALKAVRLNASALPDRIWYLWTPAWRRS